MGLFDKLFTPNVEALKKKRNIRRLLQILDKEMLSNLGLQAIEALGELKAPEALRNLKLLFERVAGPTIPCNRKDALFQSIGSAIAQIEGRSSAGEYLMIFRSPGYAVREHGLATEILGQLKDARALNGMIWQLGSLSDFDYSRAGTVEEMMLLTRALGHLGDTRAVAPLIVASYRIDQEAAKTSVEPYRSAYLSLKTVLIRVLQECFGISDESRYARVPSAVYSLLVEHGMDKADVALAHWGSREDVRVKYQVQDETEESLMELWERRETDEGRDLFAFRLMNYSWAAKQRFEEWKKSGR